MADSQPGSPEPNGEEHAPHSGSEESDFGEFDDFNEFDDDEPSVPVSAGAAHQALAELNLNDRAVPKPIRSQDLRNANDEQIRSQLLRPPSITPSEVADTETEIGPEGELHNGSTATSQQLWQHLTETAWMPLPKWDGSPIHRQLALCLGVPLNLDKTLPKTFTKRLDLPTQAQTEVDGLQYVPEWMLLAEVSPEALDHKSSDEMEEHARQLEEALGRALELKEAMEAREMDLQGEKHILEGMVESLLLFSQRRQREKLQKAKKKK